MKFGNIQNMPNIKAAWYSAVIFFLFQQTVLKGCCSVNDFNVTIISSSTWHRDLSRTCSTKIIPLVAPQNNCSAKTRPFYNLCQTCVYYVHNDGLFQIITYNRRSLQSVVMIRQERPPKTPIGRCTAQFHTSFGQNMREIESNKTKQQQQGARVRLHLYGSN